MAKLFVSKCLPVCMCVCMIGQDNTTFCHKTGPLSGSFSILLQFFTFTHTHKKTFKVTNLKKKDRYFSGHENRLFLFKFIIQIYRLLLLLPQYK